MIISHFDLSEAARFADYLLGRDGKTAPVDRFLIQALHVALIVSYARPFSRNRRAPQVRASLPETCLTTFTLLERQLHQRMLELRNKAFAHSDPDVSDVQLRYLSNGSIIPVSTDPRPALEPPDLETLRGMLAKLQCWIHDELVGLYGTASASAR